MAAPYRERVQLLLIKIETTSGTDASPTGAADAIRTVGIPTVRQAFFEPGLRDDVQTGVMISTPRTGPAARYMVVDAVFEVAGSSLGTAYNATTSRPEVDPVLRIAGMGRTVVTTGGSESILYTTLDQGMETATVYAYTAGKLRKATGCIVSSMRLAANANGRALLTVTIMGQEVVAEPSEAALPSYAQSTTLPPLFNSGAANIGTWTSATAGDPLTIKSAEINFGIVSADRGSAGAVDGLIGFLITDRKVRQRLTVEVPAIATFSAFQRAKDISPNLPLSAWQVGSVQYNRLKVQTGVWALEVPEPATDKGIRTHVLNGNLTSGAPTSGREVNLLFD